jgi:hypothetical protein
VNAITNRKQLIELFSNSELLKGNFSSGSRIVRELKIFLSAKHLHFHETKKFEAGEQMNDEKT